jgi:hypothetical protein
MATQSGLEAFTVYLDPTNPEDIPILRYLKPKVATKRAAGEIRRAMLLYIEYMKGSNAMPVSQGLPLVMPQFHGPAQLQAPFEEQPAGGTKAIQEARRSFMKR